MTRWRVAVADRWVQPGIARLPPLRHLSARLLASPGVGDAHNEGLITTFYEAFARRDPAAMAACYAPDVEFSDPVFQTLRGSSAGAMWNMLAERATDLQITFSDVTADATTGRCHWEARYPFTRTGRQVHNVVEARFEFRDGLISRHADTFDLWRWESQALGPAGALLGWLPPFQARIRSGAQAELERYVQKRSAG